MVKFSFVSVFLCFFAVSAHTAPIDCNVPETMQEKVICRDDTLRSANNRLKEVLAQKAPEAPEMIKYYLIFWNNKLKTCTTGECIDKTIDEALTWLEKEQYKQLKDTAEAPRCQIQNLAADCEVYAYSQYNGQRELTDVFISDEQENYLTSIKLNRPGKCVIVFLSSYQATIWDIYVTPETKLKAINVGSYYPQMLRGMPESVQTKNRRRYSGDKNDICLDYYYEKNKIAEAIENLNLNFKEITVLDNPIIGEEVPTANYYHNPQIFDGSYVAPDIKPGKLGLDQLIKAGKIRKGSKTDITKLKAAGIEYMGGSAPAEYAMDEAFQHGIFGFYIMLDNFEKLPKGLAGANSISLFVPKDLIAPDNNGGHSNFYQVNATVNELGIDTANQQTNPDDEIDLQKAEEQLSQLEAEGKIRKEIIRPQHNDYVRINKAGYEYIKGSIPKDNIEGYAFRNIYIMLDNFPELPRGFDKVSAPHLFIPRGLTPPEPNGFSSLFWINAPIEEVRNWK